LLQNNRELEGQVAIEQKLRRELNKNLNQDLDLKRERDKNGKEVKILNELLVEKEKLMED